jgi:hypothetical protein
MRLGLDRAALEALCRRHRIRRLALLGAMPEVQPVEAPPPRPSPAFRRGREKRSQRCGRRVSGGGSILRVCSRVPMVAKTR